MTDTDLELQPPELYRADRPHLFPSEESLRWFMRQNRAELVAAGAIVRPTGRWLIEPVAFRQVLMAVGTRRAATR